MDKKTNVEILASDLHDVADRLQGYGHLSEIPKIEIDLFLSKIRNVYEEIYQSGKAHLEDVASDKLIDKVVPVQQEVKEVQQSVFELVDDQVVNDVPILNVTREEKISPEEPPRVIEEKKEEIPANTLTKPTEEHHKEVKTKHEPEILADRFTAPPSFHESLAHNKVVPDLSSKLQSMPIQDIQHSISLNEKFVFIKELFEGNSALYSDTIRKLNEASGYESAMQYIYNNFKWDMDGEIASRLVDLVRRKHKG
jgi:hypothetical protein